MRTATRLLRGRAKSGIQVIFPPPQPRPEHIVRGVERAFVRTGTRLPLESA